MTQKQPALEELAKQAEEAMADLARTFPAMATSSLQEIKLALAEAMGTFDRERTDIIKNKLYPKVHDLKGQGATFGYPLITDVGAHLCKFLVSKKSYNSADLQQIKQEVQAIETILWKKLKGDGGAKGAAILDMLRKK
ncbi:MAG: hypothetical protein J6Y85_05745 [Alphaproteobacteria bacterium]|nr:hypothetical protein [Alphaproteobacteria bacterium]